MPASGITKNSAGAETPTVGLSDRNDYCVEEIEAQIMTWADDISNNDGVMASYQDIAADTNKLPPEEPFLDGWETAYNNFVEKRASVATTSYAFIPEMARVKDVLYTYRNLFWAEEEAVNAEIKRLEDVKADYDADVATFESLLDDLDPLDPTDATDYATYTYKKAIQTANSATTQEYITGTGGVKPAADAIFGKFNTASPDSNSGQTGQTTAAGSVNKEFEDMLETIFAARIVSSQKIGTIGDKDDIWGNSVGSAETDTPVALLNYFGTYKKIMQLKESVSQIQGVSFTLSEYDSVTGELVGYDMTTTSSSWVDNDGVTQTVYYPNLNAVPDADQAILTTYLNSGVSSKYLKDGQESLSSMVTQVANAESSVQTQLSNLEAIDTSTTQTNIWDTDLDNLETARTQYSSWIFTEAPEPPEDP